MPKQGKVAAVLAALVFQLFGISQGFFVGQVHVVFTEKTAFHDDQGFKRNYTFSKTFPITGLVFENNSVGQIFDVIYCQKRIDHRSPVSDLF